MPVLKPQALLDNRVEAVREQARVCGGRVELDLSGGIDSAVMLGLAVLAVGADNIATTFSDIGSKPEMKARAQSVAQAMGVPLVCLDLTAVFNATVEELLRGIEEAYGQEERAAVEHRMYKDPTVLGSYRSCMRAPIGRELNRMMGNGLRLGTGNECEDRYLRFYQKGGDGEVDCNPMAMLSKGEVYQLAVALGQTDPEWARALRPIIEAAPDHDLWNSKGDSRDESELKSWTGAPFTYSTVSPSTGEYLSVGTIERVSRFLDVEIATGVPVEALLFAEIMSPSTMAFLTRKAENLPLFQGVPKQMVGNLLRAARRVEAGTRHKMNPNCPSLGSRQDLLDAGILTNDMPV